MPAPFGEALLHRDDFLDVADVARDRLDLLEQIGVLRAERLRDAGDQLRDVRPARIAR